MLYLPSKQENLSETQKRLPAATARKARQQTRAKYELIEDDLNIDPSFIFFTPKNERVRKTT